MNVLITAKPKSAFGRHIHGYGVGGILNHSALSPAEIIQRRKKLKVFCTNPRCTLWGQSYHVNKVGICIEIKKEITDNACPRCDYAVFYSRSYVPLLKTELELQEHTRKLAGLPSLVGKKYDTEFCFKCGQHVIPIYIDKNIQRRRCPWCEEEHNFKPSVLLQGRFEYSSRCK